MMLDNICHCLAYSYRIFVSSSVTFLYMRRQKGGQLKSTSSSSEFIISKRQKKLFSLSIIVSYVYVIKKRKSGIV